MICSKCSKEFEPSKGFRNFCSYLCRNSREFSVLTKQRTSETLKIRWQTLSDTEKESHRFVRKVKRTPECAEKIRSIYRNKFDNKTWDELGKDGKRRRVLEEQNNVCNRCKLTQWFDIPLSLEIDHIDGISDNDVRENLEALCPNCHSLTPTWRGRNKPSRNGNNKVSDSEIVLALAAGKNIRQTLLMIGMAAKGANYKRIKRLMGL